MPGILATRKNEQDLELLIEGFLSATLTKVPPPEIANTWWRELDVESTTTPGDPQMLLQNDEKTPIPNGKTCV